MYVLQIFHLTAIDMQLTLITIVAGCSAVAAKYCFACVYIDCLITLFSLVVHVVYMLLESWLILNQWLTA